MFTLAVLKSVWGALTKIPWWIYVGVALIVYHFAAIGVAESRVRAEDKAEFARELGAEKTAAEKEIAAVKAKQQDVITKTMVEYRDRIKIVKEKGDEIVKEVPVYVPMDSPLLSSGVRVFHDAAASGVLPDDPVRAIGAADPVETSTLLSTVAANYESCRADQERLAALQKLVSTLGETK